MLPKFIIFSVTIYSYPLLMGMAWGFSYQILDYINKWFEKPLKNLPIFFLCLFTSSWLGAKLLFIFTSSFSFEKLALNANFWLGGGFVFYGGLLAGIMALIIYFGVLRLSWSQVNILLPSLAFGHAIGRIGCYLAGCCYGKETDVSWAVYIHDHLRHPVQLYESIFLIILGIYFLVKIKRNHQTSYALEYLFLYASGRFIIEFFRGDTVRGLLWNALSTSQTISLVLIFVTAIIYILKIIQHHAHKH